MASDRLLSIVMPVFRSEPFLERTVRSFVDYLGARTRFEIVLVNDGSPDRVQEVVDRLCAGDARVRGVTLGQNVGQHRATIQGFARARGDVVVTVDDDGQNPPSAALAVADVLVERDLDVVYGNFRSVEQRALRRIASRLNRWLTQYTLGNRAGVAVTNVRAIRGDLARAMGSLDSPYPCVDAMIFRFTSRIGDVPVEHRPRAVGESSYSIGTLVRLWISQLTNFSIFPLKAATALSLAAALAAFAFSVLGLLKGLAAGTSPRDRVWLVFAVTFLFSVLFLFLGVISAYVGRMYVSFNERGLVWIRSEGRFASAPRPEDAAPPREPGPDRPGPRTPG